MKVAEIVDARKQKFDRAALRTLFRGGCRLVAAKGKKIAEFDLESSKIDWSAIEAAVLGPSGTLRAPTLRVGREFYVGFSPEAWKALS